MSKPSCKPPTFGSKRHEQENPNTLHPRFIKLFYINSFQSPRTHVLNIIAGAQCDVSPLSCEVKIQYGVGADVVGAIAIYSITGKSVTLLCIHHCRLHKLYSAS
jgi:hypothetical protein